MTTAACLGKNHRIVTSVKSRNSLLNKELLYLLFLPLPLVDSFNGMINGGGNDGIFSLGMMYRLCIITYCCFVILKGTISKRSFIVLVVVMAFIVLPHVFDIVDTSFLSLAVKTLLPVLCIEAFLKEAAEGKLGRDDFEKLIDAWSILFPLAILTPFFLGLGFQTYGSEDVGYKGFFFAQNDLCFVLSILFFFCCGKLFKKTSTLNAIRLLLIGVCIILLGMKSGYLLLCVSIAYWVMRSEITLVKRIGIIIALCVAVFAITPFVIDIVNSILNRWMYFSTTRSSFMDFLSSGRLERIPVAIDFLFSTESNPLWFIFGVGMRYSECLAPFGLIEMDLFDFFFQFGVIGTAFLFIYYLRFLFVRVSEDSRHFRFALLIAFALAFFAGHVLNSALSAMFFSVLCGLIWSARTEANGVTSDTN